MENGKIQKLLAEHGINDMDQLEDFLESYTLDCDDLSEDTMSNVCLEKKCFNSGIPLCRRVIEVYNKFYKKKYSSKKEFIEYLIQKTDTGESSLKNWLSCKQCKLQDDGKIVGIVNNNFLQDLCNNLETKLDIDNVFFTDFRSVEVFKKYISEVTKSNYKPKPVADEKMKESEDMEKQERDKLYDMVHVSRSELELNLSDQEKVQGSDEFIMNLALYAFERDLIEESYGLISSLSDSCEFKNDTIYLQLKAKILSKQKYDKYAIEVLKRLIDKEKPIINPESYNLLAASIKRLALTEYDNIDSKNHHDDDILVENLIDSKDKYSLIFNINKDYYPAINIIYIQMILVYINGGNKKDLESERTRAKVLWKNSNIDNELDKNDWWSFISDIEFLILMTDYGNALEKLESYMQNLNEDEISDFSISSTIRQLELYRNFCTDSGLDKFILKLKSIEKNKHQSMYKKLHVQT